MRRILLAVSLFISTPMAFADLINNNSATSNSTDQLENLTRTISTGSYSADQDTASTPMNVTLRNSAQKPVQFNSTSSKSYISSSNLSSRGGVMSWLKANPLPDAVRKSSAYGTRVMGGRSEHHPGIDLAAPSGTSIYASGDGVVTRSGWVNGYGQMVEINHGNGYITRYAHASRLLTRVGDTVKAGEEIAKVGCTGRCTGPHLHYEIVQDGQRKNPSTYLALLP
ncbi:MAG: M23 family metallopeptidase [Acinetobacter sp.]